MCLASMQLMCHALLLPCTRLFQQSLGLRTLVMSMQPAASPCLAPPCYVTCCGVACSGDVPYIICLDRPSRSLVLSIRGTQSLADAATDLLAYPHPLQDWLPDRWKQVHLLPERLLCYTMSL